ncbi:MAG: 2-alkenal reductase, partial [Ardenticatenia bacterium]
APSPTPLPEAVLQQTLAEDQLLIYLYERISPSVVSIQTTRSSSGGFIHPPLPQGIPTPQLPFRESGEGSGFVIDTQGHIVTNHHVVADTSELLVTFYEGTSVPATVVGSDPDSDLAVIKVDVPPESLRPVVWGDSDLVKVGQRAIAIGNPFGYENTLTTGIISGLSRSLPASTGYRIPEIIQTDTAINPGNSGGPLLNIQGEVIGINTAIVPNINLLGERSFLGIGFAVPSNMARRVVPELIARGVYDHPWLGFWGTDVVPQIAAAMNLPEARGALVIEVVPNSPAASAGLRGGTREIEVFGRPVTIGGDVIIGIDDTTVRRFDDILVYLSRKGSVGQQVTLTIIRDGQTQTLSATLAKRPPQALPRD